MSSDLPSRSFESTSLAVFLFSSFFSYTHLDLLGASDVSGRQLPSDSKSVMALAQIHHREEESSEVILRQASKSNHEVVTAAVFQDAMGLQSYSEELKSNYAAVIVASKKLLFLQLASEDLENSQEVVENSEEVVMAAGCKTSLCLTLCS